MYSNDPIECGLPHRDPFVFIEKVSALVPGSFAECTKFFAASEPFFRGHFPGNPLIPGVILTERSAQTAGIAAGCNDAAKSYRLSAIKLMKFRAGFARHSVTFRAEKPLK